MRIRGIEENAENLRVDLNQMEILSGSLNISKVWKEFVNYHSSQAFYDEVVDVFREVLNNYLKNDKKWLGKPFDQCKTGLRRAKGQRFTGAGCDLGLGVNVGVNTPTLGGTSTRGEHLDQKREVYAERFKLCYCNLGKSLMTRLVANSRFLSARGQCVQNFPGTSKSFYMRKLEEK